MMEVNVLIVLFFFCTAASSVKHTLKFFVTASHGVPDVPEFVIIAMVDGEQLGYCDNNMKTAKLIPGWMKELSKDDPTHQTWFTVECQHNIRFFNSTLKDLMNDLNQIGGVHVLQRVSGCEWDDETGETLSFNQYGYDGEDFISLDMQTMTWVAQSPRASMAKMRWDADKARFFFAQTAKTLCSNSLQKYLHHGASSLDRTELPLVSLLQKSSYSPITCHATGFYPNSAVLFWRKDGEELFEEVDHGETLPNPDGSFQTSVDLKLPSEPSADWGRYECVFQLAGLEKEQVTRLKKEAIMTNEETHVGLLVGLIVGLLLLISVAVAGVFVWRKHNQGFQRANNEQPTPEESEHLEATNQ